jgi:hypothetical protein
LRQEHFPAAERVQLIFRATEVGRRLACFQVSAKQLRVIVMFLTVLRYSAGSCISVN